MVDIVSHNSDRHASIELILHCLFVQVSPNVNKVYVDRKLGHRFRGWAPRKVHVALQRVNLASIHRHEVRRPAHFCCDARLSRRIGVRHVHRHGVVTG